MGAYFGWESTVSVAGGFRLASSGAEGLTSNFVGDVIVKPAVKGWGGAVASKGKALLNLGDDVVSLAESNITNSGKTVLGHFPSYIEKAKKIGGSYYDISKRWETLSEAERWGANEHFLNKIAEKGDDVYLSISKSQIRPGSYLQKEIKHLINSKGYRWVNQWKLIKP